MPNATGNLADFLNNVFGVNGDAINDISSGLGLAADLSGPAGLVLSILGMLEGNSSDQALQTILATIQNDFAQLNASDKAERIIQRLQNLDNITGPAETQLQQLQAHMPTDIVPCLNAINELALNPDALSNWQAIFSDQIFWTDAGEYFQFSAQQIDPFGLPETVSALDAGYGQQAPAQVADDLAFSYLYVLPDFLRTLAIFIAVAGTNDPNWAADYGPQVLQPVSNFLKNNVHDVIAAAITPLSPAGNWNLDALANAIAIPPFSGPTTPNGKWPWQGVFATPAVPKSTTLLDIDPLSISPPIPGATAANIEFGAVEKYSGYSSMSNYVIPFQADVPPNTPDIFNKFQIRLFRRLIDVYKGVGLQQVWNAINGLNALVGAPPAPPHPYACWSFRNIFLLSGLQPDPTTNAFSFFALRGFIYNTFPLDVAEIVGAWSFQQLLSP